MPVDILGISGPVTRGGSVSRSELQAIRRYRNAMVTALKEEAPINKDPYAKSRAGLRTSIMGSLTGNNEEGYTLEFSANSYVQYVLAGTRPHRINPDTKAALAFKWHTGTYKGHGFHGRGPGGGFLRSTPYGPLMRSTGTNPTLRLVTASRSAGMHAVSRGLPRFSGRQLAPPVYNQRGRMVRGPVLGHISPTTEPKNLVKGSEHYGNFVIGYVNHPGTKPNDFVARAVLKVDRLVDGIADEWADIMADRIQAVLKESQL